MRIVPAEGAAATKVYVCNALILSQAGVMGWAEPSLFKTDQFLSVFSKCNFRGAESN
jgi:hypothetical protein